MIAQGGYDVLVGFSDGGRLTYKILDRLGAIHEKVKVKTRMVAMMGQNKLLASPPTAPEGTLKGLKFFHAIGDTDLGTCDGCKDNIYKESLHCTVCHDFDMCLTCAKDMPAAIKRIPPGTHGHAIEHERSRACRASTSSTRRSSRRWRRSTGWR